MNFWMAAVLFFGGAFSYMVLSSFLHVYRVRKLAENIQESLVTYMAIVCYGFSEAVEMKYDTLQESDVEEQVMQRILNEDIKIYEAWKKRLAQGIGEGIPHKIRDIAYKYDWDGALSSLENTYYNKNLTKRG